MANSTRVFVFGTLKQGFPNFATNRGRRIGGDFRTAQRYPLYLVGERHSPWLVDMPGEGKAVTGQVFEVDAEVLADMDRLERIDQPDGYRRVWLEVQAADDPAAAPCQVWAYLKPAGQLAAAQIMAGPLAEYTLAHAAAYRPR